jgi:hypothetical protein
MGYLMLPWIMPNYLEILMTRLAKTTLAYTQRGIKLKQIHMIPHKSIAYL